MTRSGSEGPRASAGDLTKSVAAVDAAGAGPKASRSRSQSLAVRTPSAQELRPTAVKHRVVAPARPRSRGAAPQRKGPADRSCSAEEEAFAESGSEEEDDDEESDASEDEQPTAAQRPASKLRSRAASAGRRASCLQC